MLRLLILAGLLALAPGLRAGAQVNPDDARRTLDALIAVSTAEECSEGAGA